MVVYQFDTPISEAEIRQLQINDVLYLNGTMVTARDQAHRRALEYFERGKPLPIDLEGLTVFHCGPIVIEKEGQWDIVAAGPTTSMRMEPFEESFLKNFKPRVIIGKGEWGEERRKLWKNMVLFTGLSQEEQQS